MGIDFQCNSKVVLPPVLRDNIDITFQNAWEGVREDNADQQQQNTQNATPVATLKSAAMPSTDVRRKKVSRLANTLIHTLSDGMQGNASSNSSGRSNANNNSNSNESNSNSNSSGRGGADSTGNN